MERILTAKAGCRDRHDSFMIGARFASSELFLQRFLLLSAESAYSRAAKLGDCLSARWLMKVHHSLATYHGGAADMNKRCAMWLPTFLQRGIHFFGRCPETTPRAHARRIVQIEPRLIENRVFRWGRCRSQRRARLPQHVL